MPDDRRAADRIRMTVQVLRRRVHDEIEPVLQRVLQVRRRERVVADGHDPAASRDGRDGAEVDDLEERIGRRFHPDHARVRPQRRLECGHVREVDERHLKPRRALAHVLEQAVAAAVEIVHGDDVRAAVEQIQNRGGGREPRGKREAGCAALEIREAVLKRVTGGIRRARVFVPLVHAGARLHVRGRGVDRRDDRAGQRIRFLPPMDDSCAEAVCFFVVHSACV